MEVNEARGGDSKEAERDREKGEGDKDVGHRGVKTEKSRRLREIKDTCGRGGWPPVGG